MKKIIRATTISRSLEDFCKDILRELSQNYEVIGLSSPGPELEIVEKREGVRTIAIPMERHISLFKDLASLVKLIMVFRKERPDMVHSMTPKAGLLCMMAGKLTGVPVRIHTFTGLVFPTSTGLKRRILMATDRLTCACATHIIPEGEGVKADLLNNGITKKPIKVLGYGNVKGCDMDYFSRRDEVVSAAELIKDNSKFTYLFIGRVVKDKGINELIAAFKKLYSSHPNIRLVLVGPYEDDMDPISEESREAIDTNVDIIAVGKKTGVDLLAYYAASDCFVFPSYREGFPNTVIEAGAMGLPSIVTDINGSREIIINGENGIIVPSKDADALHNAMLSMLQNGAEREKMAGNARAMIASRYEQGFVRKCLYDFYNEIMLTDKNEKYV